MAAIIQSGVSIFGLISVNPALLAFILIIGLFGILNILEFKRFD